MINKKQFLWPLTKAIMTQYYKRTQPFESITDKPRQAKQAPSGKLLSKNQMNRILLFT